jgi:vacuolar iron transporter family protein
MSDSSAVSRFRDNLQGEVDSAGLYRALSESEPDAHLAEVYRRLAAVEEAHAEYWRTQLQRAGARAGQLEIGWRARALAWLARRFGPQFVLPTISALEQRDSSQYDNQPEAVAGGLPDAERSHNRIVQRIAASMPGGLTGGTLARLEGRHRMGGNALRAAVLGANDGLVSNLSLVMGAAGAVTGAGTSGATILVVGLAGLVAGACSMAIGEWLSVTSSRELNQRQIDVEADELARMPQEETEELALIYQAKGLDEKQARALAEKLMAQKDTALDTLVREELGIDPEELGGSAWTAAASSFFLFAAGAIFPVLPYFWLSGYAALGASLALSGAALVATGTITSLFTGRGVLLSAGRQLLLGFAAAALTYGVGRLAGVSLS